MNIAMLDQHYRHLQQLEAAINACALSVSVNADGTISSVNNLMLNALQLPVSAIEGQQFESILIPVNRDQWTAIGQKLATGTAVQEQIGFLINGIHPLWIEAGINPIIADNGQLTQFLIIGLNITDRKLSELRIQEDEQYFRQILENLPIGLQQFSAEGISMEMNSRQRQIWGQDHPFFQQTGYNWLQDPQYRLNGLTKLFEDVRQGRKTQKREILLNYTEKNYDDITRIYPVYYEATVFPVVDKQSNMTNLFLILDDITEKKLAEISLQKSERLLDNIIENLPIGYIQFDNFGFIRRINQTQRNFFNSPHPAARRQFNVMNDEFATTFELDDLFQRALQENEPLRLEKKVDFTKDARWTSVEREVYLDLTVFPVENPVDKERIVVALVNDITDKKTQELENIKNQEFLLQTGQIGKIGGWELEVETNTIRWSDQAYHIHECLPGTRLTLDAVLQLYQEDSRINLAHHIETCIRTGKPFDVQLTISLQQNITKRIRCIGRADVSTGQPQRIYGVVQDITEQSAIRDALSRNTELMRLFFDTMDMGYAAMEPDGLLNFVNQKAEKMIGHKELAGANIFEVFPKLSGTVFYARLQECIKQNTSQSFGIYFPIPDKWYDFLLTPMQDGGISVFIRDITESRKMQKELRKANDQLSNLNKNLVNQNKQLEDFAHITSHNLRAPIANLKALMQMHNEATSSQERELYLGMLHEVIKKIDETLNDLVEVVQIRKDVNVEKEKLSFADRLQKVKDILLVDIENSKIQIIADFERAPALVYSKVYLDSILQNFITNAIRYRSPERTPALRLQTWVENESIILTVEDNGVGIDMERFGNKLFGFRKTFHKNKDAKGIGLFITKTQVEAMGGIIKAESKPGYGTKFIITFRPE
ncbi:PAS domain-containing sensor histidine kinase [Chitinophaga sp. sic0106]|uniref:PAS domain-containing sensor histidine kinase n=1 Tax=Chitinophaga sp. sic0106 TaxID=2854785 RepID=UPI001C46B049|nr:PAS domain-containing sensor histidine kinase [Chitinophaga sp. sic0106]MBV7531500.1 PAS domain S-box protein [Chitinophaga sp. sic0106]